MQFAVLNYNSNHFLSLRRLSCGLRGVEWTRECNEQVILARARVGLQVTTLAETCSRWLLSSSATSVSVQSRLCFANSIEVVLRKTIYFIARDINSLAIWPNYPHSLLCLWCDDMEYAPQCSCSFSCSWSNAIYLRRPRLTAQPRLVNIHGRTTSLHTYVYAERTARWY